MRIYIYITFVLGVHKYEKKDIVVDVRLRCCKVNQHVERREGCIYLWLPVTCFSIGNARKEINANRTEEDAREKEGYSTL